MIQRGQDLGFALEAREAIRVAGDRRRQHLDGDRPFQVAVGGSIDLTHTPRTDLRGDFVGAEVRAGSEGQVAVKYMRATVARTGLFLSHAEGFTQPLTGWSPYPWRLLRMDPFSRAMRRPGGVLFRST